MIILLLSKMTVTAMTIMMMIIMFLLLKTKMQMKTMIKINDDDDDDKVEEDEDDDGVEADYNPSNYPDLRINSRFLYAHRTQSSNSQCPDICRLVVLTLLI